MSEDLSDLSDRPTTLSKDDRRYIFRLRREELEERFLQLREDNLALRKHCRRQDDKIKKLAQKLLRAINDRKKSGRKNDKELEELVAKMQKRIRDLYRENVELKSKLCCSDARFLCPKRTARKIHSKQATIELAEPSEGRVCWLFVYWGFFLIAFLIVYKFFMSNLCNYLLDYYLNDDFLT